MRDLESHDDSYVEDPPFFSQGVHDQFANLDRNFRDMRVKVVDLLHLERVNDLGCCRKCRECCSGFCAHSWFFTICCGYVVVSSLPRTTTILDPLLALIIYCSHPDRGSMSRVFGKDMTDFKFETSSVDILFISIFRSLILYFCFAYKYQKEGYYRNLQLALVLALSSSVYLFVKTCVATKTWVQHMAFLILCLVWVELSLFALVRRRRIRMRPHVVEAAQSYQYKALTEQFQDIPNPHLSPAFADRSADAKTEDSDRITASDSPESNNTIPINDTYNPSESSFLVSSLSSQVSMSIQEHDFREYELPLRLKHSEFIMVHEVSVHCCLERGLNEDGPWVVLLHGFGGGIFSWRRSVDYLLPHVRGILAFDRPGFGLTERPPEGATVCNGLSPYCNEFNNIILRTLMEENDITQAVLVGHSTGASIACSFTQNYPLMVQGMVLIAPSTGLPQFVLSIMKMNLGKIIMLNLVKTDIGSVTIQRSWHDPDAIPVEVTQAYRACLKLPNWGEALLAMSRIDETFSLNDAIPEITVPVKMLHGDDDKLVGFPESKRISERFPTEAELIKIRNCGHMPHEELPEIFARHVCDFIESIRDRDPAPPLTRLASGQDDHGPLLNEIENNI